MRKGKGHKLWSEAKKLIPGGSQLLSKKSERFLPGFWPSYFKKAKGTEVWDLDGKKYIDTCWAGIATCLLGYADPDVNRAVKKVIDSGSISTLNSPEEVELAKILCKIHPWADMVRFARTGGEAMAVAVRIARAYAKKYKIAFCGYHGWHDWYISANLADNKNLDGHLLPGLPPKGVPRCLKGSSMPFSYNKIEGLKRIVSVNKGIGVIVVEPMRYQEPKDDFLGKVRKIADKIGAVLVFDEISSGFRHRLGGVHLKYGVNPDIAVLGKTISNGFPMAAIIGRKKIMEAAKESFISSTYWTERVGPAAAIATINKMTEKKVTNHVNRVGKLMIDNLRRIARDAGLKLEITGFPPISSFSFNYGKDSQAVQTLFTQEMLKRGILASGGLYLTYAFKEKHAGKYLKAAKEVFSILKKAIDDKKIYKLLKCPVAETGFRRLT